MNRILFSAIALLVGLSVAAAQNTPNGGGAMTPNTPPSTGGGAPSGPAGGALGCTYPNPCLNSGALSIAGTKTLAVSNSLTLAGTDGSTLNIGGGGTLGPNAFTSTAYLPLAGGTMSGNIAMGGNNISGGGTATFSSFVGTLTGAASLNLPLIGGTLTGALLFTDNTFDIGASGATRPRTGYFGTSIISPLVNGLAIINNGSNTLNIAASKSLVVSNSMTLAGTDSSTLNIGAGGTIAAVGYSGSASDLGSGTLPNGRLTGAYTGVTGLGTIAGLTVTGSFTATGLVTNSDLANAATTVNGQSCVLGASCTVTAAATGVTVGTTTVGGGTATRVLYDNAGVLGEYTNAQLTALINPATATLSGALPAWPNNTTTYFRGDGTYATHNCASLTNSGTGCSTVVGTMATQNASAVAVTGGTIAGLTGLAVRDTSAAFDLTIAATSSTALTAGRTLTFDVVNAARTVKLGSNLTIATDPGAVTGALKSNGSGTFTQAACADLSNAASGCSAAAGITALTGDIAATGPGSSAATLATVNTNVGTFGSATQASQVTVNGKGLVTAASSVTVTPAVGSITGLGTGIATALGVNAGTAGAPVINGGALGTPSSGTLTNATGLPLAGLVQSAANTMLGNWTGSTANVTANAMPSCSDTGGNHLNYVSGTGITCGTSGGAAAAGTLTGGTLASNVLATSITSTGTLTGGATGAGFTVALTTSTVTGNLPLANGVKAYGSFTKSATQSYTSSTPAQVLLDTSTIAGVGMSLSSNAVTITVAGKYLVVGSVYANGGLLIAGDAVVCIIRQNGTSVKLAEGAASAFLEAAVPCVGILNVAANDVISLFFQSNHNTTINLPTAASTYLDITFVGP